MGNSYNERQSARMSKITNDGLIRLAQDALSLYPCGNSERQRVKIGCSSAFSQLKSRLSHLQPLSEQPPMLCVSVVNLVRHRRLSLLFYL